MIPRPLIFSSSFRHYHFQNQENKKGKEREDFERQQLKACKSGQTDHTQTTDFPWPPHFSSNFPIKIYIEREADEIRDMLRQVS